MILLFEICKNVSLLRTILILLIVLKVICTIAPILLTIMLMVDFGKNVVSGKSDDIKKNLKHSANRVIACLIIFLIPSILNYTFDLVGRTGAGYTECLTNANLEKINQLEQEELEKKEKNSTDKAYGTGSAGENSNDKGNSGSNNSKSQNSSSNGSGSETKEDNNKYNYKFEKELIVLAHYHGNKISKKKIVILNGEGEKVSNKKFDFKISKPLATVTEGGKLEAQYAGNATITATLKKDPSYSIKCNLSVIKGTYTKVRTTKTLKVVDLKTGKRTTLSSGTQGIYNGSAMDLPSAYKQKVYYHGDILKVDGGYYKVDYHDVKPYQYSISSVYSKEVAEEFVNSNEFSSNTKYLFWINLGSQEDYLFKYTKKGWKLYKAFDINTGDVLGLNPVSNGGNCNGSTRNAVYASGLGQCNSITSTNILNSHVDKHFAGHWLHVSYALHNRNSNNSWTGTFHEGFSTPKVPKSHGCVRHTSDSMKWIRDNMGRLGGSQIVNF